MPEDPSILNQLFVILKTYGPEVSILFIWIAVLIKHNNDLSKEIKSERALREQSLKEHSRELLELSKENIATIGSITRLVESLAPAISDVSGKIQHDFEISVSEIKAHISSNCRTLERVISSCMSKSNSTIHIDEGE